MIGGFVIAGAVIAGWPLEFVAGEPGIVIGGDRGSSRAVGGDTAGAEGIVSGGTWVPGLVVGGDGRFA